MSSGISCDTSGASCAPQHVAVIMDGNGRWAERNGKLRLFGHNAGMNAMTEIVRHASDLGVEYLTVYAFSTENWKRSNDEISGIFRLLVKFVEMKLRELVENNVVVSVIGDYSPIPSDAKAALKRTIDATAGNTGMKFVIALNYGSRTDILNAAKVIAAEALKNGDADAILDISEVAFASKLSTFGMPDPDLIIRTSGEKRLSNFLLWEAAYSELVFSDVLWPDFTPDEFDRCIEEYRVRNRRYGGRK